MNALAKSLAKDLGFDTRLRRETRVIEIQTLQDGFFLKCEHAGKEGTETQGPFDHVLVTAPVPQALELLDQSRKALGLGVGSKADWEGLRSVHYHPCIAWMVAFPDAHLSENWLKGPGYLALEDGVESQMISWIASNRKKGLPSAAGIESLTVHLNPKASTVHFTGAGSAGFRNEVLNELVALGVLQGVLQGQINSEPVAEAVHRWRYSQPVEQYPDSFFSIPLSRAPLGSDSTADAPGIGRIVLCGDAFRGARVEGAFLSGRNAALHLRPSLVNERGQD
jgi:predicted NAD/FAD-dependent oxidoreductase